MKKILNVAVIVLGSFVLMPAAQAQDSTKVKKECKMCEKGKCTCGSKEKKTADGKKACSCHKGAKTSKKQ